MLYKYLKQTRPPSPPCDRGYDAKVWHELDDLFRGGYQILEHAQEYLPKAVGENADRYQERLKIAAYIGYFSQIVNVYVAAIFDGTVTVAPAADAEDESTPGELPDPAPYQAFAEDADLGGTAFAQLLRQITTTALVKKKGLLAIDFPREMATPNSRADSDSMGVARPYCYAVEPETLINWEVESQIQKRVDLGNERAVQFTVGHFKWAVLKKVLRVQESPDQMRSGIVEEYRVWRKTPDGRVVWEVYRTPPQPEVAGYVHGVSQQSIGDDQDIPLADSSPTSFREIPLIELALPENLWLGNMIGPLNKEHWQRRSGLLAAQQRNLLAVPVFKLGPEIGGFQEEQPSEAQQDPNRALNYKERAERQGAVVLGKDDDFGFESPDAAVYTVIDTQLDKVVDEIYRVSGQMASSVSSTSKALQRSGASKALDRKDFTTVVSAIAAVVSDAARRCYQVISDARAEYVKWAVHGLDGYKDDEDRSQLVQEAAQADTLAIPSATWRAAYKIRTALGLVQLMPAEEALVRAEIIAATTAEEALRIEKIAPPDDDEDADDPKSAPGTKDEKEPATPPKGAAA